MHRLELRVGRLGKSPHRCSRTAAAEVVHQRQSRRPGVCQCLLLPRMLPLRPRRRKKIVGPISNTRKMRMNPSIRCHRHGSSKQASPSTMIFLRKSSTNTMIFLIRGASQGLLQLHGLIAPSLVVNPSLGLFQRPSRQLQGQLQALRHHQTSGISLHPANVSARSASAPSIAMLHQPRAQSSCASGRSTRRRSPRRTATVLALLLATTPSTTTMMSSTRTSMITLMSRAGLIQDAWALEVVTGLWATRCWVRRSRWEVRRWRL
jgi:hypothetical protein